MSYKDNLPKTMDELKAMSFDERARLWAKYSSYPFKRQLRFLWYYIQCDRLNLRIEHKHRIQIRKYKDNPEFKGFIQDMRSGTQIAKCLHISKKQLFAERAGFTKKRVTQQALQDGIKMVGAMSAVQDIENSTKPDDQQQI